MAYTELSIEERSTIQASLWQKMSLRQIATNMPQRSPLTISREVRRNQTQHCVHHGQTNRCARHVLCHPKGKLLLGNGPFELVMYMLRNRISPEPIAGKLKCMIMPQFKMRTFVARLFTAPFTLCL